MINTLIRTLAAAIALLATGASLSQEPVLNLYSARHYATDEALYSNFTKLTGIKINHIEGGEDALIERVQNEGPLSPADVLITVDAGRLWRACWLDEAAWASACMSGKTSKMPAGELGLRWRHARSQARRSAKPNGHATACSRTSEVTG